MLAELLDLLDTIPKPEEPGDVYLESGGNFDDAYDLGYDAGRASLAAEIRKIVLPPVREILEA